MRVFQLHVMDSNELVNVLRKHGEHLSTPCNGFNGIGVASLTLRVTVFQLHVMDSQKEKLAEFLGVVYFQLHVMDS